MRWEKVAKEQQVSDCYESSGPGKRWGHTCNSINGGRLLYVFGGYGHDNSHTNRVHIFDTATHSWTQPTIKGIPPTPRDSHSCTTIANNLFVFGGTDGMNPLKDLHILDTSSHTWICPSVRGEGPEAREGHSATVVGKRLFIFGGCGKSPNNKDEVYYNDIYILNTETFAWKRATASGSPPSPRDSHSCSSWNNKIIVIGGEDAHDYYLSDVHILDADTMTWRELNASGQMLTPRAGHSTVAFGKKLFVFGGFADAQNLYNDLYLLDVDTGIWTKVTTTGSGPSARFSVAGDCLDPLKNGVLVFVGGCNKSLEALDDMFYLYTGLVMENVQRPEKLSLRKQLKLKCLEQNLAHIYTKETHKFGISSDMYQTMSVPNYGQPSRQYFPANQFPALQGKKTFEAKVTENFANGYTIETVIDGKTLRGIVFSNNLNHLLDSSRKRASDETGDIFANGNNHQNKTSRIVEQDPLDNRQADDVYAKELALYEPHTEAVDADMSKGPVLSEAAPHHKIVAEAEHHGAPVLKNTSPSDSSQPYKVISEIETASVAAVSKHTAFANDSQPHKVTANQELSMLPCVSSEKYKTDDAAILNSEVLNESFPAEARSIFSMTDTLDDRAATTEKNTSV